MHYSLAGKQYLAKANLSVGFYALRGQAGIHIYVECSVAEREDGRHLVEDSLEGKQLYIIYIYRERERYTHTYIDT